MLFKALEIKCLKSNIHILIQPSQFKGGESFLTIVKLREGESAEQALRRFKKQCEKSGVLSEVKKREFYEKPSVRLKKKSIAARKRSVRRYRYSGSSSRV